MTTQTLTSCFCQHGSDRCGASLAGDESAFDGQCGKCARNWVDGRCRYAAPSAHGTHPDTLVCAVCVDRPMTQHEIMNLEEWADAQRPPSAYDTRVTEPHTFREDCSLCTLPSADEFSLCEALTRPRYSYDDAVSDGAAEFGAYVKSNPHNGLRVLAATLGLTLLLTGLIIVPSALVIASLTTFAAQIGGVILAALATAAAGIAGANYLGKL